MTENIENQKAKDAIKRKIIKNAQNGSCHNHRQATMICLTKVIIKSRDAIKIRAIGKINGTL